MKKKGTVFTSNDSGSELEFVRVSCDHPAAKAYIEAFNAKANAMSREEVFNLHNKLLVNHGLPQVSWETFNS